MKMRTVLLAGSVLALTACAVFFGSGPWFGPPEVSGREVHAQEGSATFSHALWTEILKAHVNEEGLVNYGKLKAATSRLDSYLAQLATAPFDDLGRDDKLAILINAYNAFTMKLIVDHYPLKSIKDIPSGERWKGKTWALGGRTLTLHQIEHEECRAKFVEPRVHFALNCASLGCPPLSSQAFEGKTIEAQLEAQTRRVMNDKRWCSVDRDSGVLTLSQIFSWYESDFRQTAPNLVAYVAQYRDDVSKSDALSVEHPSYDWKLNEWR